VITVRLLIGNYIFLIAAHQIFEDFEIGESIGAVRQYDRAIPIKPEHPVKSVGGGPAITERGKSLLYFFDFRVVHDVETPPVAEQAFQEVVALDIAIVV
jgi:hypothetical protein